MSSFAVGAVDLPAAKNSRRPCALNIGGLPLSPLLGARPCARLVAVAYLLDALGSALGAQHELEAARCISPAGQHATCKHLGGGRENFTLASCEAEMLHLDGDTINFRDSGICWVKRCGSSDMQYSSQFGEYQVYSTFCQPCPRTEGWCLAPGEKYSDSEDCDGDGVADPYCADSEEHAGYLSSANSCTNTWPSGTCGSAKGGLLGSFKSKLEHMGGIGTVLKKAEGEEKKLQSKLAPAEKAIDEVYKGMNQPDYNAPPRLGGDDEGTINSMACLIIGFIVLTTGLAGLVDRFRPCRALEGRPKLWALTLLVTSYLLLIPGLTNVLLSFSIIVNVIGHRIRVHPNANLPSCTESTPGLVDLLYHSGGTVGAGLLVLFAMVIPALELVLLILGEIFRFRSCGGCARVFRMAIVWVQHRSKWASPDIFAYTLLVYLIRNLDHDPLILTRAQLDIGFVCFCCFCVCATVSALGFPLHSVEDDKVSMVEVRPPCVLRCLGKYAIPLVATVLAAGFAGLLLVGVHRPVMAFRINERPLYQPVGPLPQAAKAAVDILDVPNMLKSNVSVMQCIGAAAGWAAEGEATMALAGTMWVVFVLGFSVADVLMLLLSAWRFCLSSTDQREGLLSSRYPGSLKAAPCPFMAISRNLKKLAMLDVAIVGLYVVTYCMAIYRKIGVELTAHGGIAVLFGAELLHNLLYWLVSSVADYPVQAAAFHAVSSEDTSSEPDPIRGCGGLNLNCFVSSKLFRRPDMSRQAQGGRGFSAA